jgi:hypothetical protein
MQLCRGILLFLLTDELDPVQLAVATALFGTLRDLCSTRVTAKFVDELELQTASLCDALEHALPRTEQSLMAHVLRHMGEQMRNWGAQCGYWMYPIDRKAAAHSFPHGRQSNSVQVAGPDGAQTRGP